jgi:hypothetical protein
LIFVNYRGSDEIWATEFVYARMTEAFGADTVFKAGNALNPGDVYSPILMDKAVSCPVMLACVGPDWLAAQGPDGRRRLDAEDDWVRREIAAALRAGNRVVPLLLGDQQRVAMPKSSDLPPDVRTLFGRQAARLTPGGGLDLTVPRLIERLVELVPELAARREAAKSAEAAVTKSVADVPGAGGERLAGASFSGPVGLIVAGDQAVHAPLTFNVGGFTEEDR